MMSTHGIVVVDKDEVFWLIDNHRRQVEKYAY